MSSVATPIAWSSTAPATVPPWTNVPRPVHGAQAVREAFAVGLDAQVESFAADGVVRTELDQDVAAARDDDWRSLEETKLMFYFYVF